MDYSTGAIALRGDQQGVVDRADSIAEWLRAAIFVTSSRWLSG